MNNENFVTVWSHFYLFGFPTRFLRIGEMNSKVFVNVIIN